MRLVAAALAIPAPGAAAAGADALDRLMGSKWSDTRPEGGACDAPFRFGLNPGRTRLSVRLERPIPSRDIFGDTFHCQVRVVCETTVRMFLEHETWTDDAGQPVEWWLVFPDDDAFAWRRSGWPVWRLAPARHRCALPG